MKDYRSLMAMAQEASKPMFLLKPGDGALGGIRAPLGIAMWSFQLSPPSE